MINEPKYKLLMMDKKVLDLFEKIDLDLCEYEKKQLCILLLASTTTPKTCHDISKALHVVSHSMNKEWTKENYPDQLNDWICTNNKILKM